MANLSKGYSNVGENLSVALLGFEMNDDEGTPGWIMVLPDLSCLLAVKDFDVSERGGETWVNVLPIILQIPRKVETQFLSEKFELTGPNRTGSRANKLAIRNPSVIRQGSKKKLPFAPINDDAACRQAGIDIMLRNGVLQSLNSACAEWAKAYPHMPIVHRPKPGEPRTGVLGADSATPFQELEGKPYAWPLAFEWSNIPDYPKDETEQFLKRAATFLLLQQEDMLHGLLIEVYAGQDDGQKLKKAFINIKCAFKKEPRSGKDFSNMLKLKATWMMRASDAPIQFEDFVGNDLRIHTRSNSNLIKCEPARLAFCRIMENEISAHEKMAAIAHYGNPHA